MKEIEIKMMSEERLLHCRNCLKAVKAKVFFMEFEGAIVHFINPTKEKPFLCPDCMKRKK